MAHDAVIRSRKNGNYFFKQQIFFYFYLKDNTQSINISKVSQVILRIITF